MRQPLIDPESKFTPPETVQIGPYNLAPITTEIAYEDWQALQSNVGAIALQRGDSPARDAWPQNCTLEENIKDLAWLERCHEYWQLFSYVMRREEVYSGCVYIYPIELFQRDKAADYDVDFSFWLTQTEYDKGEYEPTFRRLYNWLSTEWPFVKERIYLRNAQIPHDLRQTK